VHAKAKLIEIHWTTASMASKWSCS